MTQPKFVSEDVSTIEHALATRIRETRDAANLTQRELADHLEVSPRTVQDWEAGRTMPSARARRKLGVFFAQTSERAA